ncbi:hypothetical protein DV735_g4466, partial [Chaetothyriales sp. CBS 134920]
MTSSTKKKRERKKDFQKPKLKVGKAKPKAANHTDTSFRAKAIVLNQQLSVEVPSVSAQFTHHVSLLSSKSENQRRESLVFLTVCLDTSHALPLTIPTFLDRLCPLILDGSNGVRSQLVKLLQALPPVDIRDRVSRLLPHLRAGMTHLSKDIRNSSIDILSWLIGVAGQELVSSPGGWFMTLECFTTVLGWRSADAGRWTASKPSMGDNKTITKAVLVLADLLKTGLLEEAGGDNTAALAAGFPTWHLHFHQIPGKSNAYGYLNIFGSPPDAKSQMLEDREDRLRCYNNSFARLVNNVTKFNHETSQHANCVVCGSEYSSTSYDIVRRCTITQPRYR